MGSNHIFEKKIGKCSCIHKNGLHNTSLREITSLKNNTTLFFSFGDLLTLKNKTCILWVPHFLTLFLGAFLRHKNAKYEKHINYVHFISTTNFAINKIKMNLVRFLACSNAPKFDLRSVGSHL